ncbi:putative short-chain dehydrogenase reductase sdr [Diplodia seriata]|uniref:Putative short-chain dehydrogenase reductase sdr n=1 Tax=Diplodia seriata TaxID=420778 RepID=A0A0G2FQH2_9PEZI|nr:putative short-chain dehydrogenase reductase sdr [Diplodia seriata]
MVGVRQLDFDDYLMCFVAVVYSLETATAYLVGARYMGLANNGMTDDERAALDPSSHEASLRRGGSKAQVIGWCLYTFVLWLLKICMNACYSRVTYVDAIPALVGFPLTIAERYQISHLETRVKVGWFLIGTSYIAVLLTILLGCRSFPKNWQIQPNPGNHCQPAVSELNCYIVLFLNITTDLWLISIPVPMLWRALIPLRHKIGLTALFSAGVFVMMAAAIRCALILDISDPAEGASRAGTWAVRESFVAVVIGNLPLIYPALLHRGVRRGRIVKLGLEKGGGGMQRMVETEVQVEDGASASERGMSFSNAFEER